MTTRRLEDPESPGGATAAAFIPDHVTWSSVIARARALAPEAFDSAGRSRNLFPGAGAATVTHTPLSSPVDGRMIGELPNLDADAGRLAVAAAAREGEGWRRLSPAEHRRRVSACIEELSGERELLALLLVWEIGKPYRQALTEVDRTLDGVRWYIKSIEPMLSGRSPLGLIANVASWNYPLSVLFHSVMVQVMAGNAAIAKVPTKGGLHVLTLAFAVARRHGLPVALVSGSGGSLGRALCEHDAVAGVVFVGGRENGLALARDLDGSKRTMIEMEGVNAYGLWEFSDWDIFRGHLSKGFEYGKQRCTAYTRFVVQRHLFPRFLEHYLATVRSLRVGNPLAVHDAGDQLPDVHFGPLIDAASVADLEGRCQEAFAAGAVCLFDRDPDDDAFVPGQDRSAYLGPRALLGVPRGTSLYASEPFGPVDSIILVDTQEELVEEMNVSDGALVATVACDDPALASSIAADVRAFKVGINELRSRGDREEPFGGTGGSWSGAFVGGGLLVEAVTDGPGQPAGNYQPA